MTKRGFSIDDKTFNLYYFKGRGRAEQIRWILAAANIPFQNVCLETNQQYEQLKRDGKLQFGQLPMLEIILPSNSESESEPIRITQTQAIIRYVARNYGLYGPTNDTILINGMIDVQTLCDMVSECVLDLTVCSIGYPFATYTKSNNSMSFDMYLQNRIWPQVNKYGSVLEKFVQEYGDVEKGQMIRLSDINYESKGTMTTFSDSPDTIKAQTTYADVLVAQIFISILEYSALISYTQNQSQNQSSMMITPDSEQILSITRGQIDLFTNENNHGHWFPQNFPGLFAVTKRVCTKLPGVVEYLNSNNNLRFRCPHGSIIGDAYVENVNNVLGRG